MNGKGNTAGQAGTRQFRRTRGKPNHVDRHVGEKVRQRRQLLGLSQTKLADMLEVTFQQVQKYERGTNRVGAGRLYQFARVLDVPVGYFFEGVSDGAQSATSSPTMSRDAMQVARDFDSLTQPLKERVKALTRELAESSARNEETGNLPPSRKR